MSGSNGLSPLRRAVVALAVGAAMGALVALVVPRQRGTVRRGTEPPAGA